MRIVKKIIEFVIIINGAVFTAFLLNCLLMGVTGIAFNRIINFKGIIPMIVEFIRGI